LDFAAVELSVLGPHLAEKFASGAGGAREERHRRVKLQVVGVAQTRFERPSTLFTSSVQVQPSAEHRVGEVCLRLGEGGDRVSACHVAVPEPLDLREDEPHPVAALAAGSKLGNHLPV
jgi:hypothetical protein